MQDTVFGVLYEIRNRAFLDDAFKTKEEAEEYAAELRRERPKTWVEPIERSAVKPELWNDYGTHPIR
jgi:hypothetical protein